LVLAPQSHSSSKGIRRLSVLVGFARAFDLEPVFSSWTTFIFRSALRSPRRNFKLFAKDVLFLGKDDESRHMRERLGHLCIMLNIQSGQVKFNQAAASRPGPARSSHELKREPSQIWPRRPAFMSALDCRHAPDYPGEGRHLFGRGAGQCAQPGVVLRFGWSPIWNCHSQMSGRPWRECIGCLV